MKYAIVRTDGVTEIHEDSYTLPNGAIQLTDEQHEQLCSNMYILENGQIVINPNPPKQLGA